MNRLQDIAEATRLSCRSQRFPKTPPTTSPPPKKGSLPCLYRGGGGWVLRSAAELLAQELPAEFLQQGWVQVFLRSVEGGTSVLAVDAEGASETKKPETQRGVQRGDRWSLFIYHCLLPFVYHPCQ